MVSMYENVLVLCLSHYYMSSLLVPGPFNLLESMHIHPWF